MTEKRLDEDRVKELREKIEAKNREVSLDAEMEWINKLGKKVSFLGRDVWIWSADIETTWEKQIRSFGYGYVDDHGRSGTVPKNRRRLTRKNTCWVVKNYEIKYV